MEQGFNSSEHFLSILHWGAKWNTCQEGMRDKQGACGVTEKVSVRPHYRTAWPGSWVTAQSSAGSKAMPTHLCVTEEHTLNSKPLAELEPQLQLLCQNSRILAERKICRAQRIKCNSQTWSKYSVAANEMIAHS